MIRFDHRIVSGFACLAVLALAPLEAQDRNIRFDHLTIEDGLSQSFVNCIFQDRLGFMWFGTEEGLNLYDGQSFTVFKRDPADPSSLSHDFVWAVHEDRAGRLWVGTYGGGLDLWDWTTRRFRHFRNEAGNPWSLSHDRVRTIYEDRAGILWIGTDGGGLNRFDPSTETFSRVNDDPKAPNHLSHTRIRALFEDREGILWVGTFGGGLNRYDRKTGEIRHYRFDPKNPVSLSDDEVSAIYEDREGRLWVGTYDNGVNSLDRASGRFKRHQHDPKDPSSLTSNVVRFLYGDDSGTLWVGTEEGLNEWKPQRGAFARYHGDPADPRSLNDERLTSMFQDRGGVIWIGTMGGGLNKWNPITGSFAHYKQDAKTRTSLSSNYVNAIHEDKDGTLWIGCRGGGVNRFDRATGAYTHYKHEPNDSGSLSDDRVMSLVVDRRDRVWVGTYGGGLNRLDRAQGLAQGKFTHYRHVPGDPGSLSVDGVMSLHEDRDGTLWVGLFEGGLDRFDPETDSFHHHEHDPADPSSLSNNRVTVILEDSTGTLWVGTDGGGLNRLDRRTGKFTVFRNSPADPKSLSSDSVWSLHEDASGALWVGTGGGGLNRWDPADRKRGVPAFRIYSKADGLPNEFIYGVLSDARGDVWFSTNNGLVKVDADLKTIKTYTTVHGLQSNEFNFGAYYRSRTGELFFGGINGFNAFYPDRIRGNPHPPRVLLTTFLKNNHRIELDRPLFESDEVEVDYRDYLVSFDLAALDYTAPEKNHYAYKLEGFDEDWIDLGTLRRVTFTNLPPGAFTLRAKGTNSDGVWSENGPTLKLRVHPPPWRTWWAFGLYLLALGGVVFAYARAQVEKRKREAEYTRKLEQQVRERTQELEARTEELATSNGELQRANQKLEQASVTDSLTGLRNRHFLVSELRAEFELAARYYENLTVRDPKLAARVRGDLRLEPVEPSAQRVGGGAPTQQEEPSAQRVGGGAPTQQQKSPSERRTPSAPDFLFLMIDLDGFKPLNDNYGHAAGDAALVQVGELLRKVCRNTDTIIRWGGDEFMVVARNFDREQAEATAERIRRTFEEHPFHVGDDGARASLSCSIGFAFYPFMPWQPEVLKAEQVMKIADRALYVSKTSGRNAWVGIHATPTSPTHGLLSLIDDQLENLAVEGMIELRSSIHDPAKLVRERA